MSSTVLKRLQQLNAPDWYDCFRGIKRGFEKECLRVDAERGLATTPHPKALGASLTHPLITTDYSEGLLEFITPPTDVLDEPLKILTELHQYTHQVLDNEILWSGSFPCVLPGDSEIPIAQYGNSNVGRRKAIYRQGLGHRYGRRMQTIAGVHYNFSFPSRFWEKYHVLLRSSLPIQDFISEQYLALSRNCLRWGWLFPLLFGSSPAMDASFFNEKKTDLEVFRGDTLLGRFATSLRLSDVGYHNPLKAKPLISYNSYADYIATMQRAIRTEVPAYDFHAPDGYAQLNNTILQTEDEYYALIRPKRVAKGDERMLTALIQRGIEYVEVRALDVNPFSPIGVLPETQYFLDAFLLLCLLTDSPPLSSAEHARIEKNLQAVANQGRALSLQLQDEAGVRSCMTLAFEKLDEMVDVAALLDKAYTRTNFSEALACVRGKLESHTLPSARIIADMLAAQQSFIEVTWQQSMMHHHYFKEKKLSGYISDYYATLAFESVKAAEALEQKTQISFDVYLQQYLAV